MNGDTAAPIYKYLKSSKGGVFGDGIKWNFSKFLVDKNGNVVDRYAPTTSPLSIEVRNLYMTHMMQPRYNELFVLSIFLLLMSAEGLAEVA